MRVEDQGAHLPSGFEVGSMKLVKIRQDPMIISKLTLLEMPIHNYSYSGHQKLAIDDIKKTDSLGQVHLIRVNKGCKKSVKVNELFHHHRVLQR
jgi:hypothetical protein